MKRSRLFVLFALCWPGLADPGLDRLSKTLMAMRSRQPALDEPRGATPQLTLAKHQLRDWAESRLAALPRDSEDEQFSANLNSELHDARLLCDEGVADQLACARGFEIGFLERIRLRRLGGFLMMQTGVGIECGYDESAYLFSWSDGGWRRVWQTEQNTYTKDAYQPQTIHSVQISPYSKTGNYVVLTLGAESWCQSNLHNVYYRAFRLGPDPDARPLVEGAAWAHVDGDPPIHGTVSVDDVLVEFTALGFDAGAIETVRHYRIDHDNVRRIDPLALRPTDFIEEWLNRDWLEAAHWSEQANRGSMLDWHDKLAKDPRGRGFLIPTMHCPKTPDLWQVDLSLADPSKPTPAGAREAYFMVRWRPPYRFSVVSISDQPSPDCSEKDRTADERRTLFPGQ